MLLSIANLTVEILPRYAYTEQMCRGYCVPSGTPLFSVAVTDEEIRRENATGEPLHPGYLESLAIYRKLARKMTDCGFLLFHASVLEMDGVGYAFTAPSGTGKSTHTALWEQVFGDRVRVINDDKPLLRVTDSGIFACGTPWDGKHHKSVNRTVPLRAVCFLARGEENRMERVPAGEAWMGMLKQTFRPDDPEGVAATLSLLDRAVAQLDFFRLFCTPEPAAAILSHRYLSGEVSLPEPTV